MRMRLRLHPAPLNGLTVPTISGAAVVGQTLYFVNGTYSATPDSITPSATVGGAAVDMSGSDSLLLLDMFAGSAVGYSEIAHKAGYIDSSSNSATSTGSVANIDLTSAITAFTRTSASTVVPMTWSVTFGSNVYEGYYLRAQVYSDSALTTRTQDVTHLLTHADLQSGATIDLTADGLTTVGATQWLSLTVFTTSPNGYGYSYTYPTALSPTDAIQAMTWSPTDSSNITLSNGNLTATGTGVHSAIRGSRGIGTGKKVYWELTSVTMFTVAVADSSAAYGVDWGSATDGLTPTADAGTYFSGDGGIIAYSSTIRTAATTWLSTDTLQVALDTTVSPPVVYFGKNNTWQGGGNPAAGTGGLAMASIASPIYPAAQSNNGKAATINPGTTPGGTAGFTYTPPTGFVAP